MKKNATLKVFWCGVSTPMLGKRVKPVFVWSAICLKLTNLLFAYL
jgi:hypothetical protein